MAARKKRKKQAPRVAARRKAPTKKAPSFLKVTSTPLSLPPSGAAPSGTPAPVDRELPFTMQYQQQSNWCWAAVSVSVALFYSSSSKWTQCTLVNDALGQKTCCATGGSAACNQPWYLDRALQIVQRFRSYAAGAATFSAVQNAMGPAPSRRARSAVIPRA